MNKFMMLLMTTLLIVPPCRAANLSQEDDIYMSRLSEFFYSQNSHEVLGPVKLLGEVARPGLYHLPEKTTLTTLLSIAGGPLKEADFSKVTIAHAGVDPQTQDLDDVIRQGKDTQLHAGDIVYIPQKKYFFDPQTTNTIAVVSALVSIVVSGYVLAHQNK